MSKAVIKFRGHLGGFNKKDVNNYIKEKDRIHAEELDELRARLAEAEKLAESAKSEKDALLLENERIKAEIDAIAAEKPSLSESVSAPAEAKAAASSDNAELSATAEPLGSKAAEKPAAHAYGDGGSPDEIVESAKKTAQRIIVLAERECEEKRAECDAAVRRLRAEAEEQSAFIRSRLAQTAGSFLTNISSDLSESIESCIREINACVTDMGSEIKMLLSKMERRSDEMSDRISYYQGYLADGIDETLTKISRHSPEESRDA